MAIFDNLTFRYCPSLDTAGNGTSTLQNLTGTGVPVGANNGTLTGMDPGTDWVADTGNGGVRALDFDGSNDKITFAHPISPSGSRTISMWAKFNNPAFRQGLIGTRPTISSQGFVFLLSTTNVIAYFHTGGGLLTSSTTINSGTWYHLAVTFSGNTVKIYKNGVLLDTSTSFANDATPGFNGVIGCEDQDSSGHFVGRLDDICIFNTEKSSGDIAALASQRGYLDSPQNISASGGSVSSGQAVVSVDYAVAQTVFDNLSFRYCPSLDTTGNGTSTLYNLNRFGSPVGSNNSTLMNMDPGTDWVSDTNNGGIRALDFDGLSDHVTFPNMLNGRGDFTLCFWIYFRTFNSSGTGQIRIMCATGPFGSNMEGSYSFTLNFTSNAYHVEAYIPFSGGWYGSPSNPTAFSSSGWKFIAVVRSGSTLRLYIDNNSTLHTGVPSGTMQVNYPVLSNNDEINSNAFDGRLDDICFFNAAKSAAELTALSSQRGYLAPLQVFNISASGGSVSSGQAVVSVVQPIILNTSTLPVQVIGINKITNVSHIGVEVLGDMVQAIQTKTSTLPTQVIGTNKITNVTHLGVEILGANAVESQLYVEEGSGGVVSAGQIIFSSSEIASGGVALSGEFVVEQIFDETALGGVVSSGEFIVEQVRDFSEIASGGAISSGESIVTAIQNFNEIGSGGVEVSGTLRNRFKKSLGFKCEKSQNDIGLACLKCIDEDDKDLIDIVTMRYLQIETPRNRLDRVSKFSGAYLPSITICRQKLFED